MPHFRIENIRRLLAEAFSDQTLRVNVYDIKRFNEVYRKLTATSKKADVIGLVIEMARQQPGLLEQILEWIESHNPELYTKHEPYFIDESEPPEPGPDKEKENNPFSYGNAISDPERFIGRRREIEQLHSRLHNAEFESSAIVGERRVGKTSLLKYLAQPETIIQAGFSAGEYLFVYIDLQIIGPNKTPSDFWQRVLRSLKYRITDKDLKDLIDEVCEEEAIDAFILDDLFTMVDDLGLHVVLLLDEFERVTQNPAFDVDFFSGLRATAIHHNLALIPSSRRELIELTHSKEVQDSPFFNIFSNVTLKLFSEAEARELLGTYLTGHRVHFTEQEIVYLLEAAGPHPYFLQMLGYHLYEAHRDGLEPEARRQYIEEKFYEGTGPMFSVYWEYSPPYQRIMLVVLALRALARADFNEGDTLDDLKQFYQRAERTLSSLEKRSLILDDDAVPNRYRPFSVVFCRWIADDLVAHTGDSNVWLQWQQDNRDQLGSLSFGVQQRVKRILPRLSSAHCDSIGEWLLNRGTVNQAVSLLERFLDQYKQPATVPVSSNRLPEQDLLRQLSELKRHLARLNLRSARYTGSTIPEDLARDIRETRRQIKEIEDYLSGLVS